MSVALLALSVEVAITDLRRRGRQERKSAAPGHPPSLASTGAKNEKLKEPSAHSGPVGSSSRPGSWPIRSVPSRRGGCVRSMNRKINLSVSRAIACLCMLAFGCGGAEETAAPASDSSRHSGARSRWNASTHSPLACPRPRRPRARGARIAADALKGNADRRRGPGAGMHSRAIVTRLRRCAARGSG